MSEKSAVVFAVDALARDKNAVPDFDSIELYEWALREAAPPLDYAQSIGVLRARWAKANPTSPNVVECLKACVLAWDLVNAQQVCLLFILLCVCTRMLTIADRGHIRQGPTREEQRQEHILEHHVDAPPLCEYLHSPCQGPCPSS